MWQPGFAKRNNIIFVFKLEFNSLQLFNMPIK